MQYLVTLCITLGYYNEQDEYEKLLLPAIKALRQITGLGLKEAKDVLDSLYFTEGFPRVTAQLKLILNLEQLGVLGLMQIRGESTIVCTEAEPFKPHEYLDCSANEVLL